MKQLLILMTFVFTALGANAAHADTNIYVHGFVPSGADLSPYNNTTYSPYSWGSTLPDSYFVNWNSGVAWQNGVALAKGVFDSRCLRSSGQSCTVICHSTGCAITSAALDLYGTSSGVPRWRINRVLALGSAEGGTELSSPGSMAAFALDAFGFNGVISPAVSYLSTSTVRGAYDHNDTAGTPVFHVAGYDGGWGSTLLPGQDDGVIAFHSACGYVKVFSATQCSNDWEWVRKTSFGVPYYVQRTVSQWTNHRRVEYCGRDACDKTHMQLMDRQFQDLVLLANP